MNNPYSAYTGKKKKQKREHAWMQFFLSVSVAVILFTLGIFIGLLLRNNDLINSEILARAREDIRHILVTREWNTHYGGVYVEKKEGVESSPYLDAPDIETVDGKIYTLKNPALMTREISELFEKGDLLKFHMTSRRPLNPKNTPDDFENEALGMFDAGEKEVYRKVKNGGRTDFRYMAPLFVEEGCLTCHAKQGYKIGDLRGGISVRFDITEVEKNILFNSLVILTLGIVSAVTLLGLIYSFAFVLKRKLDRAQLKIKELTIIDDLTGIYNRRYFFNKLGYEVKRSVRFRQSIGCIMADIDHFKAVNDRYGHDAGDMVLKNVAAAIRSSCRGIDIAARYGGEEFIIFLPGTSLDGAANAAEKIRSAVENLNNKYNKTIEIHVTVSLGVSAFTHVDLKEMSDNDPIVKSADNALYRAKEKGRNRVERG